MKPPGDRSDHLVPLFAQPHLSNARMETRAVTGSLDSTFRAILNAAVGAGPDVMWIGYAAPMIAGDRSLCCWNANNGITCEGCMLEPGMANFPATSNGTVHLEGATEFYVFFRVETKQVEKFRTFSVDCTWTRGPSASSC